MQSSLFHTIKQCDSIMTWHITWLYAFIICLQIAFWLNQKQCWMQKFKCQQLHVLPIALFTYFLKNLTCVLNFTGCLLISFLVTADKSCSADNTFTFIDSTNGTVSFYQIGKCDWGERRFIFIISLFQLLFYVSLTDLLKSCFSTCFGLCLFLFIYQNK